MGSKNYKIYGVPVSSDYPLETPASLEHPALSIRKRPALFFKKIRGQLERRSNAAGLLYHALPDRSEYLYHKKLAEFWISSDGKQIAYRRLTNAPRLHEAFSQCLTTQALSFSLVKLGQEPIHATVLERNGRAVALVGDSGFGKSTLALALIESGFRLLTDDLLVLNRQKNGFLGAPGLARIKLTPPSARFFLGKNFRAFPMNPMTQKLIYRLPAKLVCQKSVKIAGIYLLSDLEKVRGEKWSGLRPVTGKTAIMEIINAFYNLCAERDRHRDLRQFQAAYDIVKKINVRKLYYPKGFKHLKSAVLILKRDLDRMVKNPSLVGKRPTQRFAPVFLRQKTEPPLKTRRIL